MFRSRYTGHLRGSRRGMSSVAELRRHALRWKRRGQLAMFHTAPRVPSTLLMPSTNCRARVATSVGTGVHRVTHAASGPIRRERCCHRLVRPDVASPCGGVRTSHRHVGRMKPHPPVSASQRRSLSSARNATALLEPVRRCPQRSGACALATVR